MVSLTEVPIVVCLFHVYYKDGYCQHTLLWLPLLALDSLDIPFHDARSPVPRAYVHYKPSLLPYLVGACTVYLLQA